MTIVLASLLLFFAVFYGARQRRNAMQTIGRDSAPSILAAQRIKASLADMDANVANQLMAGQGAKTQSIQGYDADHAAVAESLVRAAENITYGDAERKPIQTLAFGLGTYEEQVAQARLLHDRQDPNALALYRQAIQTLHGTLFPAAEALSKANNDVLSRTYGGVQVGSTLSFLLLFLTGGLLLAALVVTQGFLSQKMRRTLNPALLAATVVTAVWIAYAFLAFGAEVHHLKVAREDAFTSLQALWEARAVAYDSNTDESRWLLDRAHAAEYETAFFQKTAQLVGFSQADMYTRMQTVASEGTLPSGTTGFLAQELANITFEGEKEAATQTVRTFGTYVGLDARIRALENAGQHSEATAFCTSMSPGESNWAFTQFDKALGKTLDINQRAFDAAVEQGFADVRGMEAVAAILAVIVAALAFVGLQARFKEYAV